MELVAQYRRPLFATWYATRRCNLRCSYCYVPVTAASAVERTESPANGEALIRNLAEAEVCQLAFAGGEPFLRADLLPLARLARSQGLTVQVSTNATAPDMPTPRAIRAAGFQCIQVSLDGADPQAHDAIRGAGTFARAMAFIAACQAAELPVIAAFTLQPHDLGRLHLLRRFCERLRVTQVKLQPVAQVPRQQRDGGERAAPTGEAILVERVRAAFATSDLQIWLSEQTNVNLIRGAPLRCNTDLRTAVVLENGAVGTCDFDRAAAIGNAYTEPFDELWERVKARSIASPACGCSRTVFGALQ